MLRAAGNSTGKSFYRAGGCFFIQDVLLLAPILTGWLWQECSARNHSIAPSLWQRSKANKSGGVGEGIAELGFFKGIKFGKGRIKVTAAVIHISASFGLLNLHRFLLSQQVFSMSRKCKSLGS